MKWAAVRVMCCATLIGLVPGVWADEGLRVGAPAPALTLRQILQAPRGVRGTWDELKGQAVVLEFWATWCGGCVDNIPHLNDLVEKFKAKPIQFISITDEMELEDVRHFLERHPISGWVAFDSNAETFKRYGIEGRPRTVLVSGNGIVRAVTNPISVTPQVLDDLLANKALDFPDVRSGPLLGLEPGAPTPLLQVLIRPAAPVEVSGTSPGGVVDKNGRYDAYGETLREILSDAYNIPEARIDAPEWCSRTRYDLSVATPQHEEALRWPVAKQALDAAFGLKLHVEVKDTQTLALRTVSGLQPKLRTSSSGQTGGYWNHVTGEIEVIDGPIEKVASAAHYVLGIEIFDETGFAGRYDFALKWDPKQPSSIAAAIREQLGLELVPEQRKLEHLVVDSVHQPRTW
ncbi:MAG TPA: TIGR03435 family protein [Candidatus Methylomirabilis sp.]|nr:TIGR03435 family protein [Candidatus Methylomirabilis sp.]